MRKLLIILLFVIALAQIAAVFPLLSVPAAPILAKIAPILMGVCAVVSAILLMKRSKSSAFPYLVGFAAFLAMEVAVFGPSMLKSSILGFVVAGLFFLPSVKSSS